MDVNAVYCNYQIESYGGAALIGFDITNCSSDEAEKIFDEIIFPYMSTDNLVVGELSLVDGRVPEYGIYIACEGFSWKLSCFWRLHAPLLDFLFILF